MRYRANETITVPKVQYRYSSGASKVAKRKSAKVSGVQRRNSPFVRIPVMKSQNAAAARAAMKAYSYNASVPMSTESGAAVTRAAPVVRENRDTPYAFTSSSSTNNSDMTRMKVASNPPLPSSAAERALAG
jgi:hypothetical protein